MDIGALHRLRDSLKEPKLTYFVQSKRSSTCSSYVKRLSETSSIVQRAAVALDSVAYLDAAAAYPLSRPTVHRIP